MTRRIALAILVTVWTILIVVGVGAYIAIRSVMLADLDASLLARALAQPQVMDKDGKATRWGGEWGGVTQLSQGGINRFTLKVGDKIIIDGAPARDTTEHKVLVRQVVRPATATSPEFKWTGRVQ